MLTLYPRFTPPPMTVVDLATKMELAEKLKGFIRRAEKSQREVADEIGVDETYVSKLVNGQVNWTTSRKYFGPLARALGLTESEIKALNPSMVLELSSPIRQHEGDDVRPADLFDYIFLEPRIIAHAGPGDSLETMPRGPVRIAQRGVNRNAYTESLLVSGDSMVKSDGSGIHDGDLMMVDPTDLDLRDGDVYLIRVNGNGFYLKRAAYRMGEWWLASDNPLFPPYKEDEATVVGCAYLHLPQPRKP